MAASVPDSDDEVSFEAPPLPRACAHSGAKPRNTSNAGSTGRPAATPPRARLVPAAGSHDAGLVGSSLHHLPVDVPKLSPCRSRMDASDATAMPHNGTLREQCQAVETSRTRAGVSALANGEDLQESDTVPVRESAASPAARSTHRPRRAGTRAPPAQAASCGTASAPYAPNAAPAMPAGSVPLAIAPALPMKQAQTGCEAGQTPCDRSAVAVAAAAARCGRAQQDTCSQQDLPCLHGEESADEALLDPASTMLSAADAPATTQGALKNCACNASQPADAAACAGPADACAGEVALTSPGCLRGTVNGTPLALQSNAAASAQAPALQAQRTRAGDRSGLVFVDQRHEGTWKSQSAASLAACAAASEQQLSGAHGPMQAQPMTPMHHAVGSDVNGVCAPALRTASVEDGTQAEFSSEQVRNGCESWQGRSSGALDSVHARVNTCTGTGAALAASLPGSAAGAILRVCDAANAAEPAAAMLVPASTLACARAHATRPAATASPQLPDMAEAPQSGCLYIASAEATALLPTPVQPQQQRCSSIECTNSAGAAPPAKHAVCDANACRPADGQQCCRDEVDSEAAAHSADAAQARAATAADSAPEQAAAPQAGTADVYEAGYEQPAEPTALTVDEAAADVQRVTAAALQHALPPTSPVDHAFVSLAGTPAVAAVECAAEPAPTREGQREEQPVSKRRRSVRQRAAGTAPQKQNGTEAVTASKRLTSRQISRLEAQRSRSAPAAPSETVQQSGAPARHLRRNGFVHPSATVAVAADSCDSEPYITATQPLAPTSGSAPANADAQACIKQSDEQAPVPTGAHSSHALQPARQGVSGVSLADLLHAEPPNSSAVAQRVRKAESDDGHAPDAVPAATARADIAIADRATSKRAGDGAAAAPVSGDTQRNGRKRKASSVGSKGAAEVCVMCDAAPQLKSQLVCDTCYRTAFLSLRARPAPRAPSPPPAALHPTAARRAGSNPKRHQSSGASSNAKRRVATAPAATLSVDRLDAAQPVAKPTRKRAAKKSAPRASAARTAAEEDNLADGRPSCARALPAAAWLPAVRRAKQRRLTQTLAEHRVPNRSAGVYLPPWLADVVTLPRADWARLQELRASLKLQVGRSCTAGFGLFATEAIEEDTLVAEYIGVVARQAVADVVEARHRGAGHDDYQFRLSNSVVDATVAGGMARYINHSCAPNCVTRQCAVDGTLHIGIFSGRRVAAGEELCYDYKFPMTVDPEEWVQCLCGAHNCDGWMNRAPHESP